jgi:hypothetical protein
MQICHYILIIIKTTTVNKPIPVAKQSLVSLFGRVLAGIVGLNPKGGMDVCLLWVLCVVKAQVSVTDWSLIQSSPTECVCVCVCVCLSVIMEPQKYGGLNLQ